MARKTKEDALQTRQNILMAALDIFYQKGLSKSSLNDIADAAGVTRGAIYWHFKNKNDIFIALHEEIHIEFMGKFDAPNIENIPPLQHLEELSISILEDIDRSEMHKKFFTVFFFKCDYSGELAELLDVQTQQRKESFQTILGFVLKAVKRGDLPADTDSAMLVNALFCYVSGMLNEHLRQPDHFKLDGNIRPMIQLFFKKFT